MHTYFFMNQIVKTFQTSHFSVLSIGYEKANAQIRGRFAFFDEQVQGFIQQVYDRKMGDAFVVSTCNRTEIYTTTHNYMMIAQLFCNTIGVDLMEFMQFVEVKKDRDALNHLFRVSAGLESQILGDFEIISQIKSAFFQFKLHKNTNNPYLEKAINSAILISKRIKNETGISNGAASVSYAAVHYILNHEHQLSDKNILLLGVGEIGQNTIENLVKHMYKPKVKIANRTAEKAEKISEKRKIPSIPFEELNKELQQTDILIVATGASKAILHTKDFPQDKKMLIVDLSIPNNVDAEVKKMDNIQLIDVDELSLHINKTIEQRRKEIPKAEQIIEEMTKEFLEWEKKRKVSPHIHHFKSYLTEIQRIEELRMEKKMEQNPLNHQELSDRVLKKITNRFAKYMIENPRKSEEVSKLLDDIFQIHLPKEKNDGA